MLQLASNIHQHTAECYRTTSKKVIIVSIGVALAAIVVVIAILFLLRFSQLDIDEKKGAELRMSYKSLEIECRRRATVALWNYETNMTKETENQKYKIGSTCTKGQNKILSKMKELDWQSFKDPDLKKDFKKYLDNIKDPALETAFYNVVSKMKLIYLNIGAPVCDSENKTECDLNNGTESAIVFKKGQESERLKHEWVEWQRRVGRRINKVFKEYVRLRKELYPTGLNKIDKWLVVYHDSEIEQKLMDLWLKIRPLYLQMHAYVRKQLYNKYGPDLINRKGPIPVHLHGDAWLSLVSYSRPYPNKSDIDITPVMRKKNFTALKMFQMADEFFQSINLTAVNPGFWKNSILTYPKDGRNMNCHPSSMVLGDEDFRIKLCTAVNGDYLEIVFHEMGHIQYYMQYSHQPFEFRSGTNPGFHEAIGNLIALSATSSKHLRKIGLLEDDHDDNETNINELYRKAADKLAKIPFTYLLDRYRFALFKGQVDPKNFNCYFWKLKEGYEGLEPPVRRTEEDCDAVTINQMFEDESVTEYFVSLVLQFQFHKALCKIAGEYEEGNDAKKLSNCDIYQSVKAGNALGDMLKLGSSVHWREALKQLTGESEMDASGLLEYFEPLRVWLEKENERTGELIGWEKSEIEFCTEEQEAELQPVLASDNMATIH